MRIHATLATTFALLAACAPAAALPTVDSDLFWTAPAQPRAGEPLTLLLSAGTLQDLDPQTQPQVTVDGNTVQVALQIECSAIFCDAISHHAFQVQVPALPAGTYTVQVYNAGVGSTLLRTETLEVTSYEPPPAPIPVADVMPAEGFWYMPDMPGTGLYLQVRGRNAPGFGTLGLGVFDFNTQGTPVWRSGATALQRGAAAFALPVHFDGSCIGCTPWQAPSAQQADEALRLRFESARTGWIDLADGTTLAIVSLPFGADYVQQVLADPSDAHFGGLPLPDLAGPWMLEDDRYWNADRSAYQGSDQHPNKLLLCPPIAFDGGIEFLDQDKQFTLRCRAASEALPAHCALQDYALVGPVLAIAALGDIEEDRMRFVRSTGQLEDTPFIAVRASQDYRVYITPPPGFCNRDTD